MTAAYVRIQKWLFFIACRIRGWNPSSTNPLAYPPIHYGIRSDVCHHPLILYGLFEFLWPTHIDRELPGLPRNAPASFSQSPWANSLLAVPSNPGDAIPSQGVVLSHPRNISPPPPSTPVHTSLHHLLTQPTTNRHPAETQSLTLYFPSPLQPNQQGFAPLPGISSRA